MSTVILAGSLREANAYCRDKQIRAIFASSSAQVQRATTIIQLPSFVGRRDRFALQQARDSRLKYGKGVQFVDEADWIAPKWRTADSPGEEYEMYDDPEAPIELPTHPLDRVDFTDELEIAELKRRLNTVGLTLKKLPGKKSAEAPIVDAPVGF